MQPILLCGKTGTKLEEIKALLKSSRNIDTEIVYATKAIAAKEENKNTIIIYISIDLMEAFDNIYHANDLSDIQKDMKFQNETVDYRNMNFISDIYIYSKTESQIRDIVYMIWDKLKDMIGNVE